jgi:hypothetical protein
MPLGSLMDIVNNRSLVQRILSSCLLADCTAAESTLGIGVSIIRHY